MPEPQDLPQDASSPPRADGAVDADMLEKARRLDALPANAPGADKTWVLLSMRSIQRLLRNNWEIYGDPPPEELRAALDSLKRR